MTAVPVRLHRKLAKKPRRAPEPWTSQDTLWFAAIGLVIFNIMFAFMYSLGNM
jgi:hypothetical protein